MANSALVSDMASVKRRTLMGDTTKASTRKTRGMARGSSVGLMGAPTEASSRMIPSMDSDC